ncbi:AAA family ATPase [Spiribacter sp. 218]|uniref:AAA family ATPase n=1 Tax=Spiribacter pallidus TaxID=1987936 RepID=UPI00349F2DE9
MQNIFEPQRFGDLVFASADTKSVLNDIRTGALPFPSGKHGIILYGSFGTGKTASAPIICDMIEQANSGSALAIEPYVIDCEGSERIDQILNTAEDRRQILSANLSNLHYFIFDEVDSLTDPAQRKLRMFMQRTHVVTVMTTNYIDKLDGGLKDRCYQLEINPLTNAQMRQSVLQRVKDNNLTPPTEEQLEQLIASSNGSWRQVMPKLRKFYGV